jgi:hypothetical protein
MSQEVAFAWFMGVGLLTLIMLHLIRSRLRERYPDLFVKLGSPEFQDSNLKRGPWELQGFVWWGHISEVRDTILHVLCVLACLFQLVGIYFLVKLV